ncbi:uncharacterized protein LOC143361219 [Halictus rubicundus]|uniref:uncharacterized protein LOC143361219 n=1 Tax=Halictus rubicundus TaxID=77578 RepID=UPI004036FE44
MGRYFIRKRTASEAELQKSDEKSKAVVTKATLKPKSSSEKESHAEYGPRLRSRRQLATRSKDSVAKQQTDLAKEPDKNDNKKNQKVTRNKKLKENSEEQVPKTVANSSLSRGKQQSNNVRKKRIIQRVNKNMSSLRQTSIKESFLNQSKKLLSARQRKKTSQKDLTLLRDNLSPRSRKSLVMVKRLSIKKEKVPIYKCSLPEHSAHDASEIYEFNFDINDSKERIPKKRRRKIAVKKALITKKKTIASKKQAVKKVVNKEAKTSNVPLAEDDVKSAAPKESNVKPTGVIIEEDNIESTKVSSKNTKSTAITSKNNVRFTDVTLKETEKKSAVELLQSGNCMEPINKNQLPENAEKNVLNNVELSKEPLVQSPLPKTTSTESLAENIIKKPKVSIKSIHDFNNKKITMVDNLQISKSDDFRPFRPTNIFNNKFLIQQRNMLNNSLFEKSLSPITKISENMEFNSPWRAPPVRTFSQVRNLFQSTPQNIKHEISNKRLSRTVTNESKNYENTAKRRGTLLENNENVSPGYINTNHSRKKNPTISRKFGTVITNIDHSVQSNFGEEISGRLSMEVENTQSSVQLSNRINSGINNFSVLHSTENNVNNTSNSHTPRKNFKIETNQIQSPWKNVESTQTYVQKENLDPQPGPSGMQKVRVLSEQRGVLRQTSLNNFLNIPDMPESTTVTTAHGIFDDISSTPISKSVKKPKICSSDLKNAFGFCDDDSRQDVSPVKQKITNDEKKPFARISINEIKNQFLSKKPKKNIQPLINTTNEVAEIENVPAKPKQNVLIDIANFSDTFDVCSENGETPETNTSEIPLFFDLEPSHFKEPPRYSYKRKRNVKFSFSDEETEEEEKQQVEIKRKRKKIDKMKNGQECKLSKWVEDINKTFSEIDQFELVVE